MKKYNFNLYNNKTNIIYICKIVYIKIVYIKTASPIGLKFFLDTHGWPWDTSASN